MVYGQAVHRRSRNGPRRPRQVVNGFFLYALRNGCDGLTGAKKKGRGFLTLAFFVFSNPAA